MQTEDFEHLYALEDAFWWFRGMRSISAALLDPVCPPGPARAVLDAGCGTGGNLDWLRTYAGTGRLVGVDIAERATELARSRQRGEVLQGSVLELPFGTGEFDLVTSFDVLPQLPGAGSDQAAVKEMARVLRPGGVLLVRAAAYEWLWSAHDEALGTQRRYRVRALVRLLRTAGFEIVRTTYANTLLLPLVALHRLVLSRARSEHGGSDVRPLSPRIAWIEPALAAALGLEARLLSRRYIRFPAGVSAICLGRKPPAGSL